MGDRQGNRPVESRRSSSSRAYKPQATAWSNAPPEVLDEATRNIQQKEERKQQQEKELLDRLLKQLASAANLLVKTAPDNRGALHVKLEFAHIEAITVIMLRSSIPASWKISKPGAAPNWHELNCSNLPWTEEDTDRPGLHAVLHVTMQKRNPAKYSDPTACAPEPLAAADVVGGGASSVGTGNEFTVNVNHNVSRNGLQGASGGVAAASTEDTQAELNAIDQFLDDAMEGNLQTYIMTPADVPNRLQTQKLELPPEDGERMQASL